MGGVIAGGYTRSNSDDIPNILKGDFDAFVVKIDPQGTKQWVKTFGGMGFDYLSNIIPIDGGYIMVGCTYSGDGDFDGMRIKGNYDAFVLKIDDQGTKQWANTFGGSNEDIFNSIIPTDGGFLAAGYTNSNDGNLAGTTTKAGGDAIVVKIGTSGNILWTKVFGGSGNDVFNSISPTSDGGFIMVGETWSTDDDLANLSKGDWDAFVVKIDASGNKKWTKVFGGSNFDKFWSISPTSDGDLVAVGRTNSSDKDFIGLTKGGNDAFVVKMTVEGTTRWIKVFGGSENEEFLGVISSSDGNLLAVGLTGSSDKDLANKIPKDEYDAFIVKMDASGNKQWIKTFGGSDRDQFWSVSPTTNGGLVAVGDTESNNNGDIGANKGNDDAWTLRIGY